MLLAGMTGTFLLSVGPAQAQADAMSTTVTTEECRQMQAPFAFSTHLARVHRGWHDAHDPNDARTTASWDEMHRGLHAQERKQRVDYFRKIVACHAFLRIRAERRAVRYELFAIRFKQGMLMPARLVLTGGRLRNMATTILQVGSRSDDPWRDERFSENAPTRRSIVHQTIIDQENRRFFR